jgi:hypothetical protein
MKVQLTTLVNFSAAADLDDIETVSGAVGEEIEVSDRVGEALVSSGLASKIDQKTRKSSK